MILRKLAPGAYRKIRFRTSMARSSKDALDAPFRRMRKQKEEEQAKTVRLCDEPGCKKPGEHRAPKDRRHLEEYYFFCQEHVTAYNRKWNYFKNMTHEEMDEDRRRDHTWGRDTKPFGNSARTKKRNKAFTGKVNDLFGVFAAEDKNVSEFEGRKTLNRLPPEYKEAFEAMDLLPPLTMDQVRAKYKTLARALHPDLNPDDPDCEEKLKKVNTAYNTLKNAIELGLSQGRGER